MGRLCPCVCRGAGCYAFPWPTLLQCRILKVSGNELPEQQHRLSVLVLKTRHTLTRKNLDQSPQCTCTDTSSSSGHSPYAGSLSPFYVLSSSEELGVCRADRIGSFKGCWKYLEKYFVRVFENALKPLLGTDKTNSQNSSREITMASYLQGWHLSTYEVIAFPKT